MNDTERLREFVASESEAAFASIVESHLPAVLSTARRVLRNDSLAEEVAQEVFCILARKAPQLPRRVVLAAWLHRTAWHLATRSLRRELRRQARETSALAMPMHSPDPESLWNQIAPLLDEAIESLPPAERAAVLLRFFDRQPARNIGAALGVSEEAARMRVSRAVEKLRIFFARRGVACGSAVLAALLADRAVEAAPAALIQSVRVAASRIAQSSLPPSLGLKLITVMAQIKLKTAALSGVALLLALLAGREWLHSTEPHTGRPTILEPTGAASPQRSRSASPSRLPRMPLRSTEIAKTAESAALRRLREILYSPERDFGMPPDGIAPAIQAAGSERRAALNVLLAALRSNDLKARQRAAASLQFFREYSRELVPELVKVFRDETDRGLIQYAGSSLAVLDPSSELMPTLVQAFKSNPTATEGIQSWFGLYLYEHPNDTSAVIENLLPLLQSDNLEHRFTAAMLLTKTTAKENPQLRDIFVSALNATHLQSDYLVQGRSFDALRGLKAMGTSARSAADAVLAYDQRMPQSHSSVLDTLAAIAPDLRGEIPELDAKLNQQAAAKALKQRVENDQVGVTGLIEALRNPEARLDAVKQLGGLGTQAADALPRLREILRAGDSDSRPDANNYLFAVATAIRQIDPAAPTYYRPEDLMPAFMDAIQQLKSMNGEGLATVREAAEVRAFSNRPFSRDEIASWAAKFGAAKPQIREVFVHTLQRTPTLSQLESDDPQLAKALAP